MSESERHTWILFLICDWHKQNWRTTVLLRLARGKLQRRNRSNEPVWTIVQVRENRSPIIPFLGDWPSLGTGPNFTDYVDYQALANASVGKLFSITFGLSQGFGGTYISRFPEGADEHALAGSTLRHPHARQVAWLHRGGPAYTGAGHRREHCNLQPD